MGLLDILATEGKKFLKDALPGGRLNPEVTPQGLLDTAALATMPVPVLGDAVGLGADAYRLAKNPEERTPLNYGLAALGALPFVPPMAGVVRGGGKWGDVLNAKHGAKLDADLLDGRSSVTLSKIVVPKAERGSGAGTQFMSDLTALADKDRRMLTLSPSSDFGGSKKRLEDFYKRFGFVSNKGRNKDFEISESMYRKPQSVKADLMRAPQDDALETARKNAVKMLGLPESNTAMDRARALGYLDDVDGAYRGQHAAPTMADDVAAPAHELNKVYPDDIYSSNAARYYGDGADDARDAMVVRGLQGLRNNPEAQTWAYRAVPKSAPDNLQHGDWVTTSKQYALDHGEGALNGDFKIISRRVPAKTLVTDGNSIYEFGYDAAQRFADGPASIPIMRSGNPMHPERSRFAAFDPKRAKENDLLGRADPALLGLIGIGAAGGAYLYGSD